MQISGSLCSEGVSDLEQIKLDSVVMWGDNNLWQTLKSKVIVLIYKHDHVILVSFFPWQPIALFWSSTIIDKINLES